MRLPSANGQNDGVRNDLRGCRVLRSCRRPWCKSFRGQMPSIAMTLARTLSRHDSAAFSNVLTFASNQGLGSVPAFLSSPLFPFCSFSFSVFSFTLNSSTCSFFLLFFLRGTFECLHRTLSRRQDRLVSQLSQTQALDFEIHGLN